MNVREDETLNISDCFELLKTYSYEEMIRNPRVGFMNLISINLLHNFL